MSESTENTIDDKLYNKNEVSDILTKRLAAEKEKQRKDQEERDRIILEKRALEDELNRIKASQAQPSPSQPATPAAPTQGTAAQQQIPAGLTEAQVQQMLEKRELAAKQQQKFADYQNKIKAACAEDKEFNDLVQENMGKIHIGADRIEVIDSKLGNFLPIMKDALKNKKVLDEMNSFTNETDLVLWAKKKLDELSAQSPAPAPAKYTVNQDLLKAAASPAADFDDDEIGEYIKNMRL